MHISVFPPDGLYKLNLIIISLLVTKAPLNAKGGEVYVFKPDENWYKIWMCFGAEY